MTESTITAAPALVVGDLAVIVTPPRGREKALPPGQRVLVVCSDYPAESGYWGLVSVVRVPRTGPIPDHAESGQCWAVRAAHLARVGHVAQEA
jgi:hypothetical protein